MIRTASEQQHKEALRRAHEREAELAAEVGQLIDGQSREVAWLEALDELKRGRAKTAKRRKRN